MGRPARTLTCASRSRATASTGRLADRRAPERPGRRARDVRAPVLTPPASRRRGGLHVGIEPAEHGPSASVSARPRRGRALFEVSSDAVLDVLPALPRGHERVAYGLALVQALVGDRRGEQRRADFWHEVAACWAGGGERAAKVRDRMASMRGGWGPTSPSARPAPAREASARGPAAYAQACEQMLAAGGDIARRGSRPPPRPPHGQPAGRQPARGAAARERAGAGAGRTASTRPRRPPPRPRRPGAESRPARAGHQGRRRPSGARRRLAHGHPRRGLRARRPRGRRQVQPAGRRRRLTSQSWGTVRVLGADPVSERQALAGDVGVATGGRRAGRCALRAREPRPARGRGGASPTMSSRRSACASSPGPLSTTSIVAGAGSWRWVARSWADPR